MTDIVERLRATGCDIEPFTAAHKHCQCRLANEAADEIERLRKRVDELEQAVLGEMSREAQTLGLE